MNCKTMVKCLNHQIFDHETPLQVGMQCAHATGWSSVSTVDGQICNGHCIQVGMQCAHYGGMFLGKYAAEVHPTFSTLLLSRAWS